MEQPPLPDDALPARHPASAMAFLSPYFRRLFELSGSAAPWDGPACGALVALVLLWAARMYATWATWGNLSVDCGREMYVPAMLAGGKMLYRDVWYGYAPLAPYVNSVLFRLFGVQLNVLYWAGSLSALGCAVLLFLCGKRLSSCLAGWTAGAVVLIEAFHAWHFSFPLAYSFSSVYGCLTSCLFLWFAINATLSESGVWMLAAGSAAAVALLLKLEFGAACYAAFFLLVVARSVERRSWKTILRDLAAAVPGVAVCVLVARWMISIRGFEFITQENLASTWPTSFFMKTYGKVWLANTGLAISGETLLQASIRGAFFAGVILELYLQCWSKRSGTRAVVERAALFVALVAYLAVLSHGQMAKALGAVFFPQDMVLYVVAAALLAGWYWQRQPDWQRGAAVIVLLAFSGLLAIRLLLHLNDWGYSIYYSGPAVLSFLLLARPMIPRTGRSRRFVLRAELLICLGCLAVVAMDSVKLSADSSDLTELVTPRGTIRVSSQVATNYRTAIQFMQTAASQGDSVLSVPEDTSLYFLSGTESPTRLFFFTPGMLAPGKMTTEVIQEIERKPVRYLLWSNRTFPDYGAPHFGTDFDQTLGSYLTSHYRRVGLLAPDSDLDWQLQFTLWERKAEPASPKPAIESTTHRNGGATG
jgi:hypothetical protein